MHLFWAVAAGNGTMAQFNSPEFGGGGQWMKGGMIMIGDMFNNGLKARVDALCYDLSALLLEPSVFEAVAPAAHAAEGSASATGWPSELGIPSTSGSQNNIRYAFFPATHRLAIEHNGFMTVYDTLDHNIGGVSQQQGGDYASMSFTSQYGLVNVASLPVVSR